MLYYVRVCERLLENVPFKKHDDLRYRNDDGSCICHCNIHVWCLPLIALRTHKMFALFKRQASTQRYLSPTAKGRYDCKIHFLKQNVCILCIIKMGNIFISLNCLCTSLECLPITKLLVLQLSYILTQHHITMTLSNYGTSDTVQNAY
jgi:hypothetical protein